MAEIIKRGEILRVDVFPSTDGKKGWMALARDANGKKLTFQIDADKLADAIEEAIDRYDLPACRDDFGVDTCEGWAIWERLAMANERKRIRQDGAAMPSALVSLLAWISVEKSRPSHNDAVWVFDGTDVFMAEHWGGSVWMSYGASRDREGLNSERIRGVTHWMEIAEPAPPADTRERADDGE